MERRLVGLGSSFGLQVDLGLESNQAEDGMACLAGFAACEAGSSFLADDSFRYLKFGLNLADYYSAHANKLGFLY